MNDFYENGNGSAIYQEQAFQKSDGFVLKPDSSEHEVKRMAGLKTAIDIKR
ncbi:hypothetical protein [Pedobacter mucosus]|uniref:hypothetical protein n=1 Tax=Pedobacter mucosus TaxID=2895286 RepID=UPI001EE43763|nr:hypothetical protein [Pedobacter mucosus]UKT63631.1 hypothetical protein LOK61_17910 [Pedobacter mucosus]